MMLLLFGLAGCGGYASEPTARETLTENVERLKRDLADFQQLVDQVEVYVQDRPAARPILDTLQAQVALGQRCIDDFEARLETLEADMAAQTDPRTSGPPVAPEFFWDNFELWMTLMSHESSIEDFLRAANSDEGLADHQLETWTIRFEKQRKDLEMQAGP